MPRVLKDILTELRELVTGDYTIDNLAADVQDEQKGGWPQLYQLIFNAGHKKATAQGGEDVRGIERKLEDANNTIKKHEATIKKLEEKVPDAAQLRQEYETREANLRKELEADVNRWKDKATTGFRMTRSQKLARELSNDENLLQPEYASDVSETKYADRFTEDEKGEPIVLQLGQRIPYAAANEDEAIKLLAKDIKKVTPAWALRSNVARGSGYRGSEGPAGGPASQRGEPQEEARLQKLKTGDYAL
jgi:predicted RNase H-like nuclease (RuvC/YqgF family)